MRLRVEIILLSARKHKRGLPEPAAHEKRHRQEEIQMKPELEPTMEHIAAAIRAAGYEPYDQLYGYLKTGDATYITRSGNARQMIREISTEDLRCYLEKLKRAHS